MTKNTSIFETMHSSMDETSKTVCFTLNELKDNGMVYTSYFDSKFKAKSYARKYCDDSSSIYIFKTYCIKIYDPEEVDEVEEAEVETEAVEEEVEEETEEEEEEEAEEEEAEEEEEDEAEADLSSMILWDYDTECTNGYVVEPGKDSKYFGQEYFNGGVWLPEQRGWFFTDNFTSDKYRWLVERGVKNGVNGRLKYNSECIYRCDISLMSLSNDN